jgi:hypothetical protein
LTSFSQTGTESSDDVKCFPVSITRLIAKDLLSGDSAKAQLIIAENEVKQLEEKVILKDNVIGDMSKKEENYKKIIDSQEEKYGIVEKNNKELEKKLKKEKVKNKFKSILSYTAIGVLTFFLITK